MADDQSVSWNTCSEGGCIGVRIANANWCLTHAAKQEPSAFEDALSRIGNEGAIDARGVQLSAELLRRILDRLPRNDHRPVVKKAWFERASFEGDADFVWVTFQNEARFHRATFQGKARFAEATFGGEAWFEGVTFQGLAWFAEATFHGRAWCHKATFEGEADFGQTTFHGDASFNKSAFHRGANFIEAVFQGEASFGDTTFGWGWFQDTTFQARAWFGGATFQGEARFTKAAFQDEAWFLLTTVQGEAWFDGAVFGRPGRIGPLLAQQLALNQAIFHERVQLEVAAAVLSARRAQFRAGVQLRVRWASVILDDADLAAPSSLAFAHRAFTGFNEQHPDSWEALLTELPADRERPRLLSVCRADVAGLRIANTDLRACRFNAAHNLDKLRIEGEPWFANTPRWWRARRKTIAEEQQWRASRLGRRRPEGGWYPPVCRPPAFLKTEPPAVLDPSRLAALYRELRKGREDARDEPGAADFYYGEMEMRRHDDKAPRAERLVLWLYWLVSGYSLRGIRAVAWLTVVVAGLAAIMQAVGFNGGDPPFRDVVIYAAQSTVSITSSNKALTEHVSWAGEMLRIILRLVGPLLLGLALLSVRNRVKR
jgi:uncharacterized protein YjbI with pentapeptide repeats